MNDTIFTVSVVLVLIFAIIATYQMVMIRMTLGPLFQRRLGTIIQEHVVLVGAWFSTLFAYISILMVVDVSQEARSTIANVLAVSAAVVFGSLVWRTHRWYVYQRRRFDAEEDEDE